MDSVAEFCRAVPGMTQAERVWLGALLAACESGPVSLSEVWRDAWFTHASGRLLILQPDSESGFLYTRDPGPENLAHAVSETLSAALLLDEMVRSGAASVHQGAISRTQRLRCLGEDFVDPRVAIERGKPRILLNAHGDYTESPSEIRGSDGSRLYTGTVLSKDAYALMQAYTCGVVMIRPGVRSAVQHPLQSADSLRMEPVREASVGQHRSQAKVASSSLGRRVGAANCQFELPPAWRARRKVTWVTALLTCKLVLAVGIAIGVYADDIAALLSDAKRVDVESGGPGLHSPAAPALVAPEAWPEVIDEVGPAATNDSHENPVGADVSQWSGRGSSGASAVFAAAPELNFAFARVGYGRRLDHEFHVNWTLMRERDMYRGAYLFLRLDEDPIVQVDNALAAMGPAWEKDLCLTVDFEEQSFNARQTSPSVPEVRRHVTAALERVRDRMGCAPLLYTNWHMGSQYLNDPQFAQYPLWIADWTKAPAPRLPPPWSRFAFWQRSDVLPDSPSPADFDLFHGSLAELALMARGSGF